MTETYVRSIEAQIIGRVFTHQGAIHFVLDTDIQTGMARCSRRTDRGPGIAYLPMTDVHRMLIEQSGISLESHPPANETFEDDALEDDELTDDDTRAVH